MVRRVVSPVALVVEGSDQELADALATYLAESTTDSVGFALEADGWVSYEDEKDEEERWTNPRYPGVVAGWDNRFVVALEALVPLASALSPAARNQLADDTEARLDAVSALEGFDESHGVSEADHEAADQLVHGFVALLRAL